MPRNDSAGGGKMSAGYNNNTAAGGSGVSADRVQPGRVMLVLREALVDDELVYQIALQAGEVKSIHRPQSNRQLVFVQYEDPDVAEHAIAMMKKLPIFKSVDPAIKSERFINDKSAGGNNNDDQQQQRSSSMNNQFNKGGGGGNRQQKGGNANKSYNNNNNNSMMNGGGGFGGGNNYGPNNNYNDVNLMTMDFESPQRAAPARSADAYQPKFSLGCWSCTRMPAFECQCGAFYCNVDCQRADWPVHKDICMPRLVPISYSSNRILEEALSAASSFSKFSGDSQQQPHKQHQQQQNQYQQQQQRQPQQQQQQNQNNRRGQTNNQGAKGNQGPANQQQQQQNQNQKKDSPRPSAAAPQKQTTPNQQPTTPKSSPEDSGSDKVTRVGNKLQRLKIAKSSAVTRGILQAGPFPREGALVKITASLSSGVVYIYHNNGKDGQQSDYYLLTNRMFKAANDAAALKAIPSVDDVIFAPFLGGYYRAKVLAVSGEKLQVFYVDFGNSDSVEWKQSREIADEDLKWAKYLTYPVRLEGVETLSAEMMKMLETVEHVEEFEMVKADSMPDSEVKLVVLKRPKQSLTLNMELMELKEREIRERKERERERLEKEAKAKQEQSTPPKAKADVKIADPSNYQPVLFDESMETSQLPCGVTKKLIIIDASEVLETRIISVVAAENVEKYAAVLEHCGLAGAKDPNVYKPVDEGEVCLVLYQEDWSRALYDISDGSYMLLDVGIIANVPAANVRRFPPQLSHVVYNNEVFVENLPKLKAMMKDGKPDSVHGATMDAKIAASDEGISVTIVDA